MKHIPALFAKYLRFLKENEAYASYRREIPKQKENIDGECTFFEWFNGILSYISSAKYIINYSFDWSETHEGYHYWSELHNKWYRKF